MAEWFEHWFDEDYALLYAHRDETEAREAVATALRAAPELASGPVLDLACGAGRHLAVLRETNAQALGLDLSEALLTQAAEAALGRLVRGDMRALPFRPATFSGIALWFTPFGYFDEARNQQLLSELAALLRPGGVLLMDYLHAAHVRATLVAEDVTSRAGIQVVSRRRIEGSRVIKEMELIRKDTGESRMALESVRLYEPGEVVAMGAKAGLRLRSAAGDYAGGAFGAESPRWIGIFLKP